MPRLSRFLSLLRTPFYLRHYSRVSSTRFGCVSRRISSNSCLSSVERDGLYSSSCSLLGLSFKGSEQIHTRTVGASDEDYFADPDPSSSFSSLSTGRHPWSEWLKLLQTLRETGYFDKKDCLLSQGDAFLGSEDLPEEFVRAAGACLSFARDHSDLLRSLSRRDIEIVVENGSPFLFRNGVDSERRMKSFLDSYGSNELKFDRASTIDLMHFLLSYAYIPSSMSDESGHSNKAFVESSVRNLLNELATASGNLLQLDHFGSNAKQIPDNYEQIPSAKKIEMKKGDWICPRCSFMNFARNMKCRECEEARPKRELIGGDWECPQCYFFNYARNTVCLRCNCKRPGEASFGTSGMECAHDSNPNKAEIKSMLAANEEKAERWFSKISQLDSAADLSSSIADEDFPEIMPLRKGESRFVVSSRKTPLQRRLANAQYRRNLGNDGTPEGISFPTADNGLSPNKTTETSITQTLDRILGRSSAAASEMDKCYGAGDNTDIAGLERSRFSSGTFAHYGQNEEVNSYRVQIDSCKQADGFQGFENPAIQAKCGEERHKGVEQTSNADYPLFSPFPMHGNNGTPTRPEIQEKEEGCRAGVPNSEAAACSYPSRQKNCTTGFSGKSVHDGSIYNDYWKHTENSIPKSDDLPVANRCWKNDSWQDSMSNAQGSTETSMQQHENHNNSETSWNRGFLGKSLEGSAVKELDPMDMSEEAKAQRWFRRVAQIKDISELSQIPDEDFPQIMPMRKGVNRFVISKRKTPLERRLSSPQYKRNLPIMNFDPEKKENESN